VDEVADQLAVSRRTVFRLLEKGVLPPTGPRGRGRKLSFKREDVALLAHVVSQGNTVRQLQPSLAVRLASRVLDSCDEATKLAREGRDLVLGSLDVIYRATKNDEVHELLKRYGRDPKRDRS